MNWELYEVWAEDTTGHEELVETTRSRKHALELAKMSLDEGYVAGIVYQETEDGDLTELQRFKNG
jgi:hypothetical protein